MSYIHCKPNNKTGFITYMQNIFCHNPSSTISFKQNFRLNILLLSLQAVSAGIFSLVLINQLATYSSKLLSYIDNVLGLGGMLYHLGNSINIPHFEIFSKIILLILVQLFILAGLFYLGGKLFGKKEGSFYSVISIISATSIISTASFILSSIFIPFFPYIINYIFLFSFICSLLLNNKSINKIFDFGENKTVFITAAVYIIYFLIFNMLILESIKIS